MSASESTVVSAEVVSSVTLEDGCRAAPAHLIDALPSGSALTTATGAGVCRFTFSASTSDAALQIYQADRTPGAMVGQPTATTEVYWASPYLNVEHDGSDLVMIANDWEDGLRRSVDAGATWQTPVLDPVDDIRQNFSIVSSNIGWRVDRESGKAVISSNLSAPTPTWTPIPDVPSQALALDAVSDQIAWYTNYGVVYLTTNAGASWTSTSTDCYHGHTVEAVDDTFAFTVGSGNVCRTINGTDDAFGFDQIRTGLPPDFWAADIAVSPGTPTTLWLGGDLGRVYRSTNNGDSWSMTDALPATFSALAVEAVSATEAYAAGQEGLLFHTTDAGLSWTRIPTPITGTVRDLGAPSSGTVTFATVGVFASTTDNGATWNTAGLVGNDGNMLDRPTEIDSVDAQTLVQSQAAGRVAVSTNGGSSWEAHEIGWGFHPARGVAVIDDEHYIAVGDGGRIATTTDAGNSWQIRSSGTSADLRDVDVDSEGVAIAVGADGIILRSDNWGGTWTTRATGGAHLRRVSIISGQPAIAVGDGGSIRRSTNHGVDWTSPSSGTPVDINSISVISPTRAYAGGPDTLLTSFDGGATWTQRAMGGMNTMAAVSEHLIWAAADGDQGWGSWAAYSTDGGDTWTEPFGGDATDASRLHVVDANRVLFGGHAGYLRRSNLAATVPDYTGGAWSAGTSAFGACLQRASGTAAGTAWTEDSGGATPGSCVIDDADPWNAVPAAPVTVAEQTASGDAVVDIVWGMQADTSLPTGLYTAGIVVQAIAP